MSSKNNGRVCNQLVYLNSLTEQPFLILHQTKILRCTWVEIFMIKTSYFCAFKLGSDKKERTKNLPKNKPKTLLFSSNYHIFEITIKPLREMFNEVMRKFSHRKKRYKNFIIVTRWSLTYYFYPWMNETIEREKE